VQLALRELSVEPSLSPLAPAKLSLLALEKLGPPTAHPRTQLSQLMTTIAQPLNP
jgi:hypothetical protein